MANHVLLVEDNDLARDAIRLLIQTTGRRVSVAGTIAEAKEVARMDPPDLVLLDLTLPDGDGLDVARLLLGQPEPPRVVALTGHDAPEVIDRCRAAGCVSVMIKPVTYKELLATIDPLLPRTSG